MISLLTPRASLGRGRTAAGFVGVITVLIWGALVALVLTADIPSGFQATTVVTAVLAIGIVAWAWFMARTPNDFLTATSTARLVTIIFGIVIAYSAVAHLSGQPDLPLPSEVEGYIAGMLGDLLSAAGIVLILLTDFVRCFTVPLRDPKSRSSRDLDGSTPDGTPRIEIQRSEGESVAAGPRAHGSDTLVS